MALGRVSRLVSCARQMRKWQRRSRGALLHLFVFVGIQTLALQLLLLCWPPPPSPMPVPKPPTILGPLRRVAPTPPVLRAQLVSAPSNGHVAFIPQIRKLVFEYCDKWPSSAPTREYLTRRLEPLAHANPHVEIVIKQRNQKEPIARGFYRASRCPAASSPR